MSDNISRQSALDALKAIRYGLWEIDIPSPAGCPEYVEHHEQIKNMMGVVDGWIKKILEEEPASDWIPVKWHEIKDAEREEEGYPKEWAAIIDSEMPLDEQEILVTTQWGTVSLDVCYEDGGFGLESGWDWMEDIIAWMPLPKSYRKEKDQ